MTGQLKRVIELSEMYNSKPAGKSKKIYSFASGKGGTGKTVMLLNLAYTLAESGKRVLVLDTNPALSNLDVMLNALPDKNLTDFLSGKSLFRETITNYHDNLDIVFGDSGNLDFSFFDQSMMERTFNELYEIEGEYDFILLDSAAGVTEQNLTTWKHSDKVILVITPEPTSVMDAYVVLKIIKKRQFGCEKLLLVNKCSSEQEGAVAFKNLYEASSHFLKEKVNLLGFISREPALVDSVLAQELFVKGHPENKTAGEITHISKKITEFAQVANNRQF